MERPLDNEVMNDRVRRSTSAPRAMASQFSEALGPLIRMVRHSAAHWSGCHVGGMLVASDPEYLNDQVEVAGTTE